MNKNLALTGSQRVGYHDLYFRIVACLIGSHILIVYGETLSTFQILLIPGYYYSLAGSFAIAMILFAFIRSVVKQLDIKFDWNHRTIERIGMQVLTGLVLPGVMAFLMAFLYFRVRGGINIFNTSYLRYDFDFIIALLLMINLYYIAYYFYARWHQAEKILRELVIPESNTETVTKTTFRVSKGSGNLLLSLSEIAYIYRNEESNFLRTVNGEDYYITETLDEVQQQLPDEIFFRANRQFVINRSACNGYELLTYGKLKANVSPAFNEEIVISQKRALAFKKWLESR
ncbi:LytTR family transcriptional regulator DNA-binding domain-containing protein [Mucilaginibacter sp. UC70_90]